MLLTSASSSGLQRSSTSTSSSQPLIGRVAGDVLQLPVAGGEAFRTATQRCRPQLEGGPLLPKLQRSGAWPGSEPSRGSNTTVVTTLHVDRLHLLEAHCAVWPHTIVAAVYAPVSATRRLVCLSEGNGGGELARRRGSFLSWLGLGGSCTYSGWSVDRLKRLVRSTHRRAQKTGQCNLEVSFWTERVGAELGAAAGLLPQAALQNRALLALGPEDASEHSAVVLLDSDMVSVDIWQLVNWPTRWARALREMSAGKALVLPAFQLTPGGVAAAAARGEAVGLAAMRDALEVATAEAGKFPLKQLYAEGRATVYSDHGFASSQSAALPELWFEAGDMHGDPDDGYPVAPQPGFAPFTMMLQRHVPWADERLRGSYYQRAWQALACRAMGLQHVVQPNSFSLQLPHDGGYSRGEAALKNFLQLEPVLRQLVEEVGRGAYVPVTSFGDSNICKQRDAPAVAPAHDE
ncbi:Glycosyltransferase LARGE2 isoform B [Micractinium conductrix]|uniref:Glycosyltransferase LARGE2 isoform B n=1 Tax=Micractinium conductrix TaxID=554055 RepID=A0A2P6VSK5_9CHLO|nr:Glycosyltransferase LARGE2 isoform B [Micractinium conductrix]|eukprot:PSC77069.1 Glycosyltransferase LARGE2 isoform B [Micractinium conductrix]